MMAPGGHVPSAIPGAGGSLDGAVHTWVGTDTGGWQQQGVQSLYWTWVHRQRLLGELVSSGLVGRQRPCPGRAGRKPLEGEGRQGAHEAASGLQGTGSLWAAGGLEDKAWAGQMCGRGLGDRGGQGPGVRGPPMLTSLGEGALAGGRGRSEQSSSGRWGPSSTVAGRTGGAGGANRSSG